MLCGGRNVSSLNASVANNIWSFRIIKARLVIFEKIRITYVFGYVINSVVCNIIVHEEIR